MKECGKCGTYNHEIITDKSACPSCGAIYAKVDASLKNIKLNAAKNADRTAQNQKKREKEKQLKDKKKKQERIEKMEKKLLSEENSKANSENTALISCKECNSKVSKKAKDCPSCGAPQNNKTSVFTWIICVFSAFWLIGFISSTDNNSNSLQANAKSSFIKPLPVKPSVAKVSLELKTKEDYRSDSNKICTKNWTKRGDLDQRMYDYCMEGQMDGYDKLISFHEYADQGFYSEIAYPHCLRKWTKRGVVDTRMLSHCLGDEVEGVKDVDYYRKEYNAKQVNKIADRALSKYGSWKMAAYSVKQAAE